MDAKSSLYFQCNSCKKIVLAYDAQNCCNTASPSLTPWPVQYLQNLINIVNEQDLSTASGQQMAVLCLYNVYEILLEDLIFSLLCRNNSKQNNRTEFSRLLNRELLINLFNQLIDQNTAAILKEKGTGDFINNFKRLSVIRENAICNKVSSCTFEELELVTSLAANCFKNFSLLFNAFLTKNAAVAGAAAQSPKQRSQNVMIVDDEEYICSQFKSFLSREGIDVLTAGSGEEALGLYRKHLPEIIFLDISLPDISGFEVLKSIRESGGNSLIYFVTGISGNTLKVQGEEMGAQGHLEKPVTANDIINIIRTDMKQAV
ncbi:MAG: response regulator [Endomicrobiales bacterium]|nr:response regulator [Endomicrobiales bacterium]